MAGVSVRERAGGESAAVDPTRRNLQGANSLRARVRETHSAFASYSSAARVVAAQRQLSRALLPSCYRTADLDLPVEGLSNSQNVLSKARPGRENPAECDEKPHVKGDDDRDPDPGPRRHRDQDHSSHVQAGTLGETRASLRTLRLPDQEAGLPEMHALSWAAVAHTQAVLLRPGRGRARHGVEVRQITPGLAHRGRLSCAGSTPGTVAGSSPAICSRWCSDGLHRSATAPGVLTPPWPPSSKFSDADPLPASDGSPAPGNRRHLDTSSGAAPG